MLQYIQLYFVIPARKAVWVPQVLTHRLVIGWASLIQQSRATHLCHEYMLLCGNSSYSLYTNMCLRTGADSLTGDRLGKFNLTIQGHASCHEYMMRFGKPSLVTSFLPTILCVGLQVLTQQQTISWDCLSGKGHSIFHKYHELSANMFHANCCMSTRRC